MKPRKAKVSDAALDALAALRTTLIVSISPAPACDEPDRNHRDEPGRVPTRTAAGRRRILGGGAFGLRGPGGAGEHRSGIAVQDLLARFLADLRFRERLSGPVAAELGAVGAAHDALGAVEAHGRLDRARTERVAIDVHLSLAEARRRQLLIRRV